MPNTHTAIIIGTGFSGICMAIKLKEKGILNFLLLEKANKIGGTWRENTYPGAECDIPSALYSYSFEPYPHWEYKWSMQPQVLEYLQHVAKKYAIYPHIHFQEELVAAEWQSDTGMWSIRTKKGTLYQSKIFIPAIGQLHHPSTPNFKGKTSFKGDSFHSAQWNHAVSLSGKTVGIIGNAASAAQFIPEVAKSAKSVLVFQRSANWMLPKQDRLYKSVEKKLVQVFPLLLKLYRLKLWLLGGALFLMLQKGNNWLRGIYEYLCIRYLKKHIKDPNLVKALTPLYPLGAKRVLFSDTYYAALARSNVQVITKSIQALEKNQWKTMEIKKEVMSAYHISIQDRLKNMVWNSVEDSWYKSDNGNSPNNFPGRTMEYMRRTRRVDFEAFEIE